MSEASVPDVLAHEITHLLIAWSDGDRQSQDRLMDLVYDPLRRLAASFLRHERPGHTLETANLVNEAYLRLVEQDRVRWRDRAHFFAIAGQVMRRILVDHARRRRSAKRGGQVERISLAEPDGLAADSPPDLLDLDRALHQLADFDPQSARLVELRYFGGLTKNETAEVMEVSAATVVRRWRMARAWLYRYLAGAEDDDT